jgi:ABC-type glycerol-3-phosphate transport system substrate-binding protein/DNA-binding transcriptional regulator YhcF (GntR family)
LVDRTSPVPIAVQLEQLISRQIADGELAPGERLPTEFELSEQLGISRRPIGSAFRQLVARGLVIRHPGRGSFVAPNAWTAEKLRAAEDLSVVVPDERWCWPLQQAAALWNDEHPDRPVRLRFRIIGPVQLREQIARSVAEGSASDISVADSVWVAEFAERGYLLSLSAIDPELAGAITADLVPPLRTQSTFHGEIYAIPGDADFALVWYRKDWFAAEGIAAPRTWDEWLACLRHFQKPVVRQRYAIRDHAFAFAGGAEAGEATTYQLLPLLWSAGADVIADHEVVLNSPAARAAVAFLTDLVRKYGVASPEVTRMPWNGPALAIAAGAAAMTIGGSYEGRSIRAAAGWQEPEFLDRIGFTPIPAGPGGRQATVLGGLSYTIFRQSQHPQLALELVARANRPDVLKDYCAVTGQHAATISATRALEHAHEPFLTGTATLFAHARPRWPIPEYTRVSLQLQRMFESAILGELDPAESVARAATVIAGITGLPERGDATWRPSR